MARDARVVALRPGQRPRRAARSSASTAAPLPLAAGAEAGHDRLGLRPPRGRRAAAHPRSGPAPSPRPRCPTSTAPRTLDPAHRPAPGRTGARRLGQRPGRPGGAGGRRGLRRVARRGRRGRGHRHRRGARRRSTRPAASARMPPEVRTGDCLPTHERTVPTGHDQRGARHSAAGQNRRMDSERARLGLDQPTAPASTGWPPTPFDIVVIGGGVTGAGVALDAATRGLSVALVEQRDLASGTSSRSSKLFHGGLRYLEQRDFRLVAEALAERNLMLTELCPHLARPVSFVYPLQHRVVERGLRRRPAWPLRRSWRHRSEQPAAPPPPPQPAAAALRLGAGPAARRPGRRDPLLGRPGRRCPPHRGGGPHRRRPRRHRGVERAGHRPAPGGRPGRRRAGPLHARPAASSTVRATPGDQRHRHLDRPDPEPRRAGASCGCGHPRASTSWCPATASTPARA